MAALLRQHTEGTGQVFEAAAVERVYELTMGQPWLVNALAAELIDVLVPEREQSVGVGDVQAAREVLVTRQDTHLDSLAERLREERVRRVIAPMLAGDHLPHVEDDDRRYLLDLGLLREDPVRGLVPANPIYAQVMPRALAQSPRAGLGYVEPRWLTADGDLDEEALLDCFLAVWRRHGQPLMGAAPYHEIAPHLVLMAFLDRVANRGGYVEREYAVGRGRLDLCLVWGAQRVAMELKVWRDGRPDPLDEGLEQLDGYLARLGLAAGWLVIFDRREGQAPLEERTAVARATTPGGRGAVVLRA